ncbi:hypothetical protein [Myroides sp. LoEW2-1]|uniref:hypothetical protein n=1 Tax=Myroides sp. LoEW2-1 TaxID=2683192 RepID=UPI0013257C22|nr:hypothetical protein [Myroides sp. LoEW2-1]MVX36228.1 hypothetical protein [Myroides sp. LoEW2-1]
MAKINNTEQYKVKEFVSKDDIVLGSNSDSALKTSNFSLGGIVDFTAEEMKEQFFHKETYQWSETDLKDRFLDISENRLNVIVVGQNNFVNGVMNGLYGVTISDTIKDGYEIAIRNSRTDYMTIVNNFKDAKIPLRIYTDNDYYLRPNETIKFRYNKRDKCFWVSGALDIRVSESDIDDILGENKYKLFIDSSAGESIDAMDMSTTLTAYVDRYFDDITDKVASWQWFRESGKTKEDQDSDHIWSLDKTEREIYLTAKDFTQNIYEHPITFICQAIIENNQKLIAKTTIG